MQGRWGGRRRGDGRGLAGEQQQVAELVGVLMGARRRRQTVNTATAAISGLYTSSCCWYCYAQQRTAAQSTTTCDLPSCVWRLVGATARFEVPLTSSSSSAQVVVVVVGLFGCHASPIQAYVYIQNNFFGPFLSKQRFSTPTSQLLLFLQFFVALPLRRSVGSLPRLPCGGKLSTRRVHWSSRPQRRLAPRRWGTAPTYRGEPKWPHL